MDSPGCQLNSCRVFSDQGLQFKSCIISHNLSSEALHTMICKVMPELTTHLNVKALIPYMLKYSVLPQNVINFLIENVSQLSQADRVLKIYNSLRQNDAFHNFTEALHEEALSENCSGHKAILQALAKLFTATKIISKSSTTKEWNIEDLNRVDPCLKVSKNLVGEGTFAKVYCGEYYGAKCAIKVTKKNNLRICKNSLHEADVLLSCSHPGIIQCFEVKYSPDHLSPVVILELMECNLVEFLNTRQITESHQISLSCDIFSALFYLHDRKRILHGNITSHNILVSTKHTAKLCDFIMSRSESHTPQALNNDSHAFYLAPEHCGEVSLPSQESDVFSAGVVMLHILTQIFPYFDNISPYQKLTGKRILESTLRKSHLSKIDKGTLWPCFVVTQCLKNDPADRPTALNITSWLKRLSSCQQQQYSTEINQCKKHTRQTSLLAGPDNEDIPTEQQATLLERSMSCGDLSTADINNQQKKKITLGGKILLWFGTRTKVKDADSQ